MLNNHPIDLLLAALGEPTRRAIVEQLGRAPASTSSLAEPFDMSLAAVVQHLQVLEAAGIVASEKIGRVRTYRLVPGGMDGIAGWIADRRSPAERRLDRLEEFLPDPPSIKTKGSKNDQ
ncbi:MAG: metalloregulator ArsR/SmtB family transcription factor [Sphingomonas sp.]|uniref:ArsR/SmtB family transcription factor n=1 Tax=Sphingomonas sp. TaxID=28214 RepID=UPI00356797A9